jgi:hypothetical protein
VLLGGVAASPMLRTLLGIVLITANIPAMRGAVLLRGPRAVRILEWDEAGHFRLWLGAESEPRPGTLRATSFRLGIAVRVLWFSTPAGSHCVFVDGGIQDPVAFRGLIRHLGRGMLIPSGPKV